MQSMSEYFTMKNEATTPKVCIILRGLPGSGKSTIVNELLKQYGVSAKGHVFSTDNFFIPMAYKLRHMGHPNPDDLPLNEAIALCQEIVDTWYKIQFTPAKKAGESAFLHVKKLFDQGQYYEAIQAAQQMVELFDTAEYRSNWNGESIHHAHIKNHNSFKDAIDQWVTPVIVDNVNATLRDCQGYATYAHKAGYEIKIQEPTSPHWKANRELFVDKYENRHAIDDFAGELAEKNKHGVPKTVILNMINKWRHGLKVPDIIEDKP